VTLRRIFWHDRSVRATQAFAPLPDTGLQYPTQDYRLNRCADSDVRCKCSRTCNEWSDYLLRCRLHEIYASRPLGSKCYEFSVNVGYLNRYENFVIY